jgi:CRP/FNR family transcriptional regulator, cyclic AMP receptor protein
MAKRIAAAKQPVELRFDPAAFFQTVAPGRSISTHRKNEIIFSQGDAADAVFYIKEGKVKIAIVSKQGKEAVVALLGTDEFFGEGCLIGQTRRLAGAAAMSDCTIMRVGKNEIQRLLQDEPAFSQIFVSHILARKERVEEDLVDQLSNSTEKRLARLLLLLANFGKEDRCKDQSGSACRDDRNDSVAREPLHEQVSGTRLHRLQRSPRGP